MSGIAKQALSYRRDVVGRDYLNKFYEEYLMPMNTGKENTIHDKLEYDSVMMEREYLRAWKIFKDEC